MREREREKFSFSEINKIITMIMKRKIPIFSDKYNYKKF